MEHVVLYIKAQYAGCPLVLGLKLGLGEFRDIGGSLGKLGEVRVYGGMEMEDNTFLYCTAMCVTYPVNNTLTKYSLLSQALEARR